MAAAGVDQARNVGQVFVSQSDPYDPADYLKLDVSDVVAGSSWMRGVCAAGDTVVAVGERQPLARGGALVLLSEDAGRSWRDISPAGDVSTFTRCVVRDDGSVSVAGSEGAIGLFWP